jgi:hypothetical protein
VRIGVAEGQVKVKKILGTEGEPAVPVRPVKLLGYGIPVVEAFNSAVGLNHLIRLSSTNILWLPRASVATCYCPVGSISSIPKGNHAPH